jgi:hypothetical protein
MALRVSPEDDAVALIGLDSATAFYILTRWVQAEAQGSQRLLIY